MKERTLSEIDRMGTDAKWMVILELSRCRFSFSEGSVKVNIKYDNEHYIVTIQDSEKRRLLVGDYSRYEPTFGNLLKIVENNIDDNIIEILNVYRNSLISGEEIKNRIYCKVYSTEGLLTMAYNDTREEFGRTFIDYEAQVKEKGYIYDSASRNGIWATQLDNMQADLDCKNYGDKVMLVKPRTGIKYIETDKEICGLEYDCIWYGYPNDPELNNIMENIN